MKAGAFSAFSESRGFTLVEILLAVFILGLALTTVYGAYSGVLRAIRDIDDDTRIYKTARLTLDRMNRDVSAVIRSGKGFVFQSEKAMVGPREFSSLFLWSAAHLGFEEGDTPGHPASIAYFVKQDSEGRYSLWRSDVPGPKPATDKKRDGGVVICENLRSLNLTFFDESGRDYRTWDTQTTTDPQKGRPPAMVGVELVLDNPQDTEKPFKFVTKISVPVRR
jgi:prepilin-type N-terminal cleavage/methylation domain-containing protein